MANQTAIQKALTQAGNVTTQREQERVRAADQTWDRRQYATKLGVSQMNGDAADIATATNNMATTTSNYANQEATAAGNFFAGAGQALRTGLAMHKPSASSGTVTPTGGVPMAQQYVTPSDAYAKKQMAVKNSNLITDTLSGNNPTLAAFNLGVKQQKNPTFRSCSEETAMGIPVGLSNFTGAFMQAYQGTRTSRRKTHASKRRTP